MEGLKRGRTESSIPVLVCVTARQCLLWGESKQIFILLMKQLKGKNTCRANKLINTMTKEFFRP